LCGAGSQQSPINIVTTEALETDSAALDLTVNYDTEPAFIFFNNHTEELLGDSTSTVEFRGEGPFVLQQYHFHTPSEHQIDGVSFPMELHMVNKAPNGDLLVISVLFEYGDENPILAEFFSNLPSNVTPAAVAIPGLSLDIGNIIPSSYGYYHYMGSLTTPPCSETVEWVVLDTHVSVTPAQVQDFASILTLKTPDPYNNRPLQAENNRIVVHYSEPVSTSPVEPTQPTGAPNTVINFNFAGMIPAL